VLLIALGVIGILFTWELSVSWNCEPRGTTAQPTDDDHSETRRRRRRRHGKGGHKRNQTNDLQEFSPEPATSSGPAPAVPLALRTPQVPERPEALLRLSSWSPTAPVAQTPVLQTLQSLPAPAPDSVRAQPDFYTNPSLCDMMQRRKQQMHFDTVHKTNAWGSDSRITTSGTGSDQKGAYDWVYHLNMFMIQKGIQTVADIPCGDVAWQFAIPSINKAKAYFGGDISVTVAERNKKQYTSHMNKIFRNWDLVECGVPKCCHRDTQCAPFDMVITRDAIQHMTIFDGLTAVRNIVASGAKYFAVSSYPPESNDRLARSSPPEQYVQKCQTDPELMKKFCKWGSKAEEAGWFYPNVMRCFPFNFPPPIYDKPSHQTFKIEDDHLMIFRVQDLVPVVAKYDQHAEVCRR